MEVRGIIQAAMDRAREEGEEQVTLRLGTRDAAVKVRRALRCAGYEVSDLLGHAGQAELDVKVSR